MKNESDTINDYQLLLFILNTSKDRSIAHILQRFENLKRMLGA
jgi:hypothetical protein